MDGSAEELLGLPPREGKYTVQQYPRIGVGMLPARVEDIVAFGVLPDGDVHVRRLVEAQECVAENERQLSVKTPLGQAILGAAIQDVVEVEVDGECVDVKVLSVLSRV
jgi:transcription elongation GreA/GreB family factor